MKKKESNFSNDNWYSNYLIEGFNPYDIMTLYSLNYTFEKYPGGFKLVLTKEGGIFPLILTLLNHEFEISIEEVEIAISNAINKIGYYNPVSDDYRFFDGRFRFIEEFIFQLLGGDNYADFLRKLDNGYYSFHHDIVKKYTQTLRKLSDKGLLKDPMLTDNSEIILSSNGLAQFNKITEKGKIEIKNLMDKLEEEKDRDSNTARNFVREVIKQYNSFIDKIVKTIVDIEFRNPR